MAIQAGCKRQLCVEHRHRDLSQSACSSDGGKSGKASERDGCLHSCVEPFTESVSFAFGLGWGGVGGCWGRWRRTIPACFNACCFLPSRRPVHSPSSVCEVKEAHIISGLGKRGCCTFHPLLLPPPLYTRTAMSGHSSSGTELGGRGGLQQRHLKHTHGL